MHLLSNLSSQCSLSTPIWGHYNYQCIRHIAYYNYRWHIACFSGVLDPMCCTSLPLPLPLHEYNFVEIVKIGFYQFSVAKVTLDLALSVCLSVRSSVCSSHYFNQESLRVKSHQKSFKSHQESSRVKRFSFRDF